MAKVSNQNFSLMFLNVLGKPTLQRRALTVALAWGCRLFAQSSRCTGEAFALVAMAKASAPLSLLAFHCSLCQTRRAASLGALLRLRALPAKNRRLFLT